MSAPLPPAVPLSAGRPVAGASPAERFPPFALPAAHFAVALAWLLAGAAGLVAAAPGLARGAWLVPATIGVTHALTLGWLLTSVMGVLYQLAPVALGTEVRSHRLGYLTLFLHAAGTLGVVAGAWAWAPRVLGLAWSLVFAGLAAWTWNLLPALRGTRAPAIARYVAAGLALLWLALLAAGARIGNALGWWMVPREALVAVHVHLALAGFGTLVVMGVGSRLFPMFLLVRGGLEWPLRWAGPCTAGGVLLYAAARLGSAAPLAVAGGAVLAFGIALFLAQVASWFRHRARRRLDPGLALAAGAAVALALAVAAGVALLAGAGGARLAGAYGVLGLVGWVTLLVGGMYAKILPFLTWMQCFSPRVGQRGLPKVGDLLVEPLAWASVAALAAGAFALAGAVLAGAPGWARGAAIVVLFGATLTLAQYARLAALVAGRRHA